MKPPTGWNEVIPTSKAIQASGAAKYGVAVGLGSGGNELITITYYMFGSRLAQLGGRFFDKDGKAVFNSPEGVAAIKWWKALNDSGVLAPGAMGMSFTQTRELLANGTIAATWEGPFAGTIAINLKLDSVRITVGDIGAPGANAFAPGGVIEPINVEADNVKAHITTSVHENCIPRPIITSTNATTSPDHDTTPITTPKSRLGSLNSS